MSRRLRTDDSGIIERLTEREVDILRLIVAGLSNREIGIQLFLTEGTVKWYNKSIFGKLDVRSRTEAIHKAHQLQLFHQPLVLTERKPKSHLPPQATAFIGRENELHEITERLRNIDCRLLTLVGVGGTGKTRLAIQSAGQLLPHFQDGVYFTPLESISSPDLVIGAIAQACHLRIYGDADPRQQLFDFLHNKELLLVLDNFEHLLDAKSDVIALLQQTRRLKILLTTRMPLHIQEEWVLTISGMAYPEQNSSQVDEQFDAVRLFLACARRSGRTLTDELSYITAICRLTQGMPLALELAASWLRTLTCEEIARELRVNTDLLATPLHHLPERHQSMRMVFQQSWNLLAENDRKTLRNLSIFRGGFTSAALRAVTGATLTDLTRLIESSLVQVTGSGRYDLHPLIAQYLQEYLHESGDLHLVSAAHAAYFAEFLQARKRDLINGRQLAAINEIQTEFENISVAWIWMLDHLDYAQIEKTWEPLMLFINVRGGGHLIDYTRKCPLEGEPPCPAVVYLYYNLCLLDDRTDDDLQSLLAAAEQCNDQRAKAFALLGAAFFFSSLRQFELALTRSSESLALFQQIGENPYVGDRLRDLSFFYMMLGEKAKSTAAITESFQIARATGNRIGQLNSLTEIASLFLFEGELAAAERDVREALALAHEFGDRDGMLFLNQFLGFFYFLSGDFAEASRLYREALNIADDLGGLWSQRFEVLTGFLASFEGDYQKADHHFKNSRAVFGFHIHAMMFIDWGQAVANCGLKRYSFAKKYLCSALRFSITTNKFLFLMLCLPPAALILRDEGRHELAIELISLWFTYPENQRGWLMKGRMGEHLMTDLKAGVSEQALDQAWQRGIRRDLMETSAQVLALLACAE